MKLVSIADLIAHRLEHESLVERTGDVTLNTSFGTFQAISFNQTTNDVDHIALVKGTWEEGEPVPVRVHASTMVGDIFQVNDFGKGPLLHAAMKHMEEVGKGVVVYLNKSLPNDGMAAELAAYAKAHEHDGQQYFNKLDSKDRGIGAQILRNVGVQNMTLLSNSSHALGDVGYGLSIQEVLPLTLD
ncbi:MAG: hypothetical protein ACPIA5_03465 [Flavobacteriales bacterium]